MVHTTNQEGDRETPKRSVEDGHEDERQVCECGERDIFEKLEHHPHRLRTARSNRDQLHTSEEKR
jgi:hypothetical protein